MVSSPSPKPSQCLDDYSQLALPLCAFGFVRVQFIMLFNFYSYFITSWGAISTCLSSPQPSLVLRPSILRRTGSLYVICTIIPLLVTTFTLAWSIALSVSYHRVQTNVDQLRAMLLKASSERKPQNRPNLADLVFILGNTGKMLDNTKELIFRLKFNSFLWAANWTLTTAMYTHSVWPLIKMIRACYKRMEEMRSFAPASEESNTQTVPSNSAKRDGSHERVGAALRRSFIFLLCHCAVMTVSLIYTFCVCIVVGVHSEHVIVMSEWRALGAWLYLVGGAFSAIAMLSQTWRSYIKFDFSQEINNGEPDLKGGEAEASQKRKWNALNSSSSGMPSVSDLNPPPSGNESPFAEEVLVISIPDMTASKSKLNPQILGK